MSYRILITEPAENDLKDAVLYIAYELKNPTAANNLIKLTTEKINSLANFPYSVQICETDSVLKSYGVRIIPVNNYLIFYRVDENLKTISITRFLYNRRNWIKILNASLQD